MPIDLDNIRIAVVDDDKMILRVFSSLMSQAKLYADFFSNSSEAYKSISAHPTRYDLLITDIYMPEADGVEFAKKVREIMPDVPIMFMTGNATEEKRATALALGRVEFLEKPFPIVDALRNMISRFLSET